MERQWNRQYHIHEWWIKIMRDTSGVRDPKPKPVQPAVQGSRTRKINHCNFWPYKPVGVRVAEKLPDYKETPLKGPARIKHLK